MDTEHDPQSDTAEQAAPDYQDPQESFPVIGIGASAGGLAALESLFEQLPARLHAAFVVVQHLSPDYESHMPDLISRRTSMKTTQVTGEAPVEANTVYFLPPKSHVVIEGGTLKLVDRVPADELNLPVDRFFRSLATHHDRRVGGVILSGTGSDGTRGLKDLADAQGLILAQDEETAQFDGMPLSAVRTGLVHIVGPVPELADAITRFVNGATIDTVVTEATPTIDRDDLSSVYMQLEHATGLDFSQYKDSTVTRRLSRRIMLSDAGSLAGYADLLQRQPEELETLADDLLIGVTRFFRDPDAYERFRARVVRPAVRSKEDGDEVRVWVAGCSTGPEAYSIAMTVFAEIDAADKHLRVKIFATDANPEAIRYAQRGVFPEGSLQEIPADYRERFLSIEGGKFEFVPRLRESIIFARHDLLKDAPFTNMDVVSCRNVLIYLLEPAQRRVLQSFAHAVKNRGSLWLGPSESASVVDQNFTVLDKTWRLFQKHRESRLPADLRLRSRAESAPRPALRTKPTRVPSPSVVGSYDRILDRFAPPSVLLDEALRPLQIFGDVAEYMQIPRGRMDGSVSDMLAEPLRTPLAMALQRIQMNRETSTSERVALGGRELTLEVAKFSHTLGEETHYYVVFRRPDRAAPEAEPPPRSEDAPPDVISEPRSAERLRQLEMELDYTKENLQATIEELETTNEELQSSNEELTSSNEELQSTNEELHSVNEELHSTNAESERWIILLKETTADLENVMAASRLAIVIVDREMEIRRLTGSAADLLRADEAEAVGSPLSRYARRLEGADLVRMVKDAMTSERPAEVEAEDRHGDPVLLRAVPYERGRGAVLTSVSLAGVRETARELKKLSAIVSESSDAIVGVDLDGHVTTWNRGASKLFGRSVDAADLPLLEDVLPSAIVSEGQRMLKSLRGAAGRTSEVRWDGRIIQVRVTPVLDEDDRPAAAALTFIDVTQLRAVEEELRLQSHAVDSASNGILIVDAKDPELPIVYANRGFETMTGFSDADIRGRNCRFLQGPRTDPADVRVIREAIRERKPCRVTLLNYKRDGTPFYNDLAVTPVFGADGGLTHFVGVQNDVTETVENALALRRSEAEYRGTFENAAVGIAHVDADGRLLRVNETLCQILGYAREELEDLTFQDITHPDDLEKDLQLFGPMMRGRIDGYHMEKRYFRKDGTVVWVSLNTGLRRDAEGEPEVCISIVQDISDRKAAEAQLGESRSIVAEVIENLEDAFLHVDSGGRIVDANRVAARLATPDAAHPEGSDPVGRTLMSYFGDDPAHPLLNIFDRVREGRVGESREHFSPRLKRWYDTRVSPLQEGVSFYFSDVTARKETELQLEKARKAAEDASRTKTQFLTNMSHEIRSPMAAVLGFADIALRDLRDGKRVQEDHLKTVARNGRFLLKIINDILDLSSVEAGKLQVRPSKFKLLPLLAETLDLMRHRSITTAVPLSVDFDGEVPEAIRSDRSRLQQILVNLIGNALKFSPGGSVRLVVRAEAAASEKPVVCFDVVDTGIGIAKEKVNQLFKSFSQVHDTTGMPDVQGTGLGLAISERLANLLGGAIDLDSVEGEGSTFTLRLPVGVTEPTLISATPEDVQVRDVRNRRLADISCRVLVADDARDVRFVTEQILKRAGAEVETVEDGAQAVAAVTAAAEKGEPFACVLMDMQMPNLDGRAATRAIREAGVAVPIVALTAGATNEEVEDALKAGCSQFLSKPVDAAELVARVAELCRDPADDCE